MFRSSDGKLTIDVVKNKANVVVPASDVSVFNIPLKTNDFDQLIKSINDVSTDRHLTVMLARHTKNDILKALANLTRVKDLEFLDISYLTYQKSGRRAGSFTHLGEPSFLFYKGIAPSTDNTNWFRGDSSPNASNHWDMSPYEGENVEVSLYPNFCWDFGLILLTLATPLSYKKIVWTLPWDSGLLRFMVKFDIKLHLVVSTDVDAMNALKEYEKTKEKL